MKYKGYDKKDKCENCGCGGKLDIHHIDGSRKLGNGYINNDPSNLITLCRDCHLDEHLRMIGIPGGYKEKERVDKEVNDWIKSLAKESNVSVVVMKRRILIKAKDYKLY